jgi:hypothetical protein
MQKVKQATAGAAAQFWKVWKIVIFLYAFILLFFWILQMISKSSDDITLSYFTRDVSAIGSLPFYAGLVSQLGGLLWSATLVVCIFTYFILKSLDADVRESLQYLSHAAILTAVLVLDDFFLFHEDVGPHYLHLSEKVIVIFYLLLSVVFLTTNRKEILNTEFLILGLAFLMFGFSIFVDAADLEEFDWFGRFFTEQFQIFLEDGFKFVGIATWLLYFVRYGYQKIVALTRRRPLQKQGQ